MAAVLTVTSDAPGWAATDQPARTVGSAQAEQLSQAGAAARSWVTLITGDRIGLDAKGRLVGIRRSKDREHIPVQINRVQGHTYAIPVDAARLIRQGRVDRRLFDVTTLNRPEYREAQQRRGGLGLIVTYQGANPEAKAELHAAPGATMTHTFKRFGGESVTAKAADAGEVWQALTNEPSNSAGSPYATAETGLRTVWLNAIQKAVLDKSVPQIGAPTAWSAGYNGKGVKIAILDTGIDTTHPDLKGRKVVLQKDFSGSGNTADHDGHGTHVASTAAGTGAKSGGKYKGVAPGAELLNGKVLGDGGTGDDAGIIAGMEWAAAQGARVINMSLGETDTPGEDPLEQAVDRLSASTGALFVVAAGNDGPGASTLGSPGSADAALTVGAVDHTDKLAGFSSRGPSVGDGSVKPDLTAPGVAITGAAAKGSALDTDPTVPHPAPGYLTIDGTSMATPHVSGAAAILAQQHPDWTGQQIKEALVSSTKSGPYKPYEQGSGRVDVAAAIKQTVVADPVSLNFGTPAWPHQDDPKTTKTVTYRNLGGEPVTLDLSLAVTGPGQKAAPEGFLTLDRPQLTVPAGGTATAVVTADTRLGSVDGLYSAYLTATGGGQTVRTAAVVNREVQSYNLTIRHIGRDGRPQKNYDSSLEGLSGLAAGTFVTPYEASGTVNVRLPKGLYVLSSSLWVGDFDGEAGLDWINQPRLELTKNMTVTVDARKAKPVRLTVPDNRAEARFVNANFGVKKQGGGTSVYSWVFDSFASFRVAHLGPSLPAADLVQDFQGFWANDEGKGYALAYGGHRTRLVNGFVKHVKAAELAVVNTSIGTTVKDRVGGVWATPHNGDPMPVEWVIEHTLPHRGTMYVNAAKSLKWSLSYYQGSPSEDETVYNGPPRAYAAGRTYKEVFNVGVFGPKVGKGLGLFRKGDTIYGRLPLFADGKGRTGTSVYDKATTRLYRNGKLIGSNTDPLTGKSFTVPAGPARYRLTTTVTRSGMSKVSTKVTADWTFFSAHVSGTRAVQLPASAVRFTPALATDSTAKAGARTVVPVSVQGAAAGRQLNVMKVWASFDAGKHWKRLTVARGKAVVTNPRAGRAVSFKAVATDRKGNTLSETILNAYRTK